MLQILSHTPTWVFALFAGLLGFGLIQTRNRTVKKQVAYVLPAAMVALSASGVQSSFGFKPLPVAAWVAGLLVVAFFLYKVLPNRGVSFDSEKNTFFIPGSWAPLAVIMAIFFTKYALAVVQGRMGAAVGPGTAAALSLAYGCFSGYFCARAASLISAARKARDSSKPIPLRGSA
jgi:hypothetical protein